jgi:hypothetical protein
MPDCQKDGNQPTRLPGYFEHPLPLAGRAMLVPVVVTAMLAKARPARLPPVKVIDP